jgi:hypothetical protein
MTVLVLLAAAAGAGVVASHNRPVCALLHLSSSPPTKPRESKKIATATASRMRITHSKVVKTILILTSWT